MSSIPPHAVGSVLQSGMRIGLGRTFSIHSAGYAYALVTGLGWLAGRSLLPTPEEAEGFRDFFSQVMPEEAAEFALDFDCASVTADEVGPDTTLTVYSDCDGGVEVRFYAVENGGHTWPGSPLAQAYAEVLGYSTMDVNATEDGWAFMSQYTLPE